MNPTTPSFQLPISAFLKTALTRLAALPLLCFAQTDVRGAASVPEAVYTFQGGLAAWSAPGTWQPRGVPGPGDQVLVDQGEALFLEANHTVESFLTEGVSSAQVVGRKGIQTLAISGALVSNKPAGILRLRGNASSEPNDGLALRAAEIRIQGAGRLRLGEYHESQTARALSGLEVSGSTHIAGGGALELFTSPEASARLGPVAFGPGGGGLLLNNGAKARREVRLGGLDGKADAVVANSELRPHHDFSAAHTTLVLEVDSGIHRFGGVIEPRWGGDPATNRIDLMKNGAGVQVFTGRIQPGGSLRVMEGGLGCQGVAIEVDTVTVYRGGFFGGDGRLDGGLTVNQGGRLYFQPDKRLRVNGPIWIAPDFGVDHLIGPVDRAPPGTYTILENQYYRPGPEKPRHWGPDNALRLPSGRMAFFQSPGLTLVVR